MHLGKPHFVRSFCIGLVVLAGVWAANYAWATMGISATKRLEFGRFVAGAGGSVTVSTSGGRTAAGGVTLVPSSGVSQAEFKVTGDGGANYSIALPADGVVALTNANGHSMALRNFTSDPSDFGQLSPLGEQLVSVGATLEVSGNQPRGSYTGSFTVTVEYQ